MEGKWRLLIFLGVLKFQLVRCWVDRNLNSTTETTLNGMACDQNDVMLPICCVSLCIS